MSGIDDIAVLTSENVRLNYTLAGFGSRMTAFLLDALIIFLMILIASIIFFSLGLTVAEIEAFIGTGTGMSILTALWIITVTLITWGYFFLYEWINWGQTPGKQVMGIKVAMADGAPADLTACAVRNVVRLVDIALAALGIVFFIMIFTPRYQRLGDLAAGTVVIKRRKLTFDQVFAAARSADEASSRIIPPSHPQASIRITDAEQEVIARFLERRYSLPQDVRRNLAKDLADRIKSRVPNDSIEGMTDEEILELAINQNRRR